MANLGSFISGHAQEYPDKTALITSQRRLTYSEYDERTNRLANALHTLGVHKGDKVATMLEGGAEYAELFFACAKMGAVMVPMVTRRLDDEIDALVSLSESSILVVASDHSERVAQMRARGLLRDLRYLIHIGQAGPSESTRERKEPLDYEQILADAPADQPPTTAGGTDPVILLSTGGTTGLPKLAIHTHESLLWNVFNFHWNVGFRHDDVCLTNLPQYHSGGMNCFTVVNGVLGLTGIIVHHFDPAEFLRTLEEEKVTYLLLMPPVLYDWLVKAGADKYDLTALRVFFTAGGNFFNRDKVRANLPHSEIFYLYGQSETVGATTILRGPSIFSRGDSVGRVQQIMDWRLVDALGEDVEAGVPGELVLRGPNLFSGYYGNAAETDNAWRDGWFHSGDILSADVDGFMYFEGRTKDVIKTGGENVYAVRVEAALTAHPAIKEVAVIGRPDPKWGEQVCACVVLEDGQSVTAEELVRSCRAELAGFEIPRAYFVVDSLPTNPVGKILKQQIRDAIEEGELRPLGAQGASS